MADGSTKPIEDVEVGDLVLATDPETGEQGPRRVTDLIVGEGLKELVEVEIDGEIIVATGGHPFWVDDERAWVDAEGLEAGDYLLLADGSTVAADTIRERTEIRRVHNLAVDQPILVHNCSLDAIKIAQHADEAGHVIPGVDELAQYVDDVMAAPGASITRGRTTWWDPDRGTVVIREADGYGTVFVPDDGYAYYLKLLQE